MIVVGVAMIAASGGAAVATGVLLGPLHFQRATSAALPSPQFTPVSTHTATATSSAAPSAVGQTNSFFDGAYVFAINAAEQKTGLKYSATGCPSGQSCLSNAVETDGENATYVGMDAAGYSGGTKCYVYVYHDSVLGWQTFAVLCGSTPGFSPVYGQSVPVRVSGGCANVRSGPGLNSPVVGCLTNGTTVKITATPSFIDNKMWWGVTTDQVAGAMSQEFLQTGS